MEIKREIEGERLTLALGGRLDTNTSPELEAEMSLDGVNEVVFDFAGLEYISSAGLRVLMTVHKAMSARGGKMRIVNPNDMVRGVFDITGLGDIFDIG